MKIKSKIHYLGEKNGILPGQMAEQLAVEVDVKNVTYGTQNQCKKCDGTRTSLDICFGYWIGVDIILPIWKGVGLGG